MSVRLFAVVLASLLLAPVALAAPPASPTSLPAGASRYAHLELGLAQPDLTEITVTGDLYAHRYEVRGKVYDADDLGQAYTGANRFPGEPTGPAFLTAIEEAVRASLESTLTSSFPGATITGVTATVDTTTLVPPGGNRFDPPVRVSVGATVERTRADVGLGKLTDDAVSAALAAGARVATEFPVTADDGHRVVFTIGAPATPAGVRFAAGPGVTTDGSSLVIEVDNLAGGASSVKATAALLDPGARPPTAEDIRSAITIRMGEISSGSQTLPLSLRVEAQVGALDVATRMPGALPASVNLPFVNADGLRALRQTGAIDDAALDDANRRLLAEIQSDVERTFGGNAVVTGGLATSDLSVAPARPFRSEPPVSFVAETTVQHSTGASGDDVDVALRIGGSASVDLTLFASNGRATTYTVHPPSIGEFTKATGGTVSADGKSATFQVAAGSDAHAATISLRGRDVPQFKTEEAEISITVDLEDLDVSLGQAAGGDFGNLVIAVTVRGELGVIELPPELRGSLPKNLELTHLASDAIRLLLDRGYISRENLTDLERSLAEQVSKQLGAALGGTIPVEAGFDAASLEIDLLSTPISGEEAIVFTAKARILKPLAGGPVQPQAAIALYTQELPLTLPRVEGLDTVYTVILPKGLAVQSVTGSGEIATGKGPGKRDQFTVRPTGDSAQVTVSMAVTPGFVLAKFWPIVLIAVLVLLMIVGTPVALVMRARSRRKAGKK